MSLLSERMSHEDHCDYYRHRHSPDKYECSCQVVEVRKLEAVAEASEELQEVADLRGDSSLPHPEDDPELWTARMQEAWDELRNALADLEALDV